MGWTVRDKGGPPPSYDDSLGEFTIKMHYSGRVEGLKYIGGEFGFIDYCHEDEIGVIELTNMAIAIGTTHSNDYYVMSNEGLTLIKSDIDAFRMCQLVGRTREVDVYAVCNLEYCLPTQCSQAGVQASILLGRHTNTNKKSLGWMDDVQIDQDQDTDEYDPESESESDSEESFQESDDEVVADDDMFEGNMDPNIEEQGLGDTNEPGYDVGIGLADLDDHSENSDDLDSGRSSDNDDEGSRLHKKKFPKFNEEADMLNPVFSLGMEFKTHVIFRDAVKEHAIKFGRKVRFVHNERKKVSAVCDGKKDCPWYIYASFVKADGLYRVKSYEPQHSCSRVYNAPWVSTRWIIKRYGDRIKQNPTWPTQSLAETIQAENTVHVNIQKCFRAKRKVLDQVEGDSVQQFRDLFGYIDEFKSTNPGITVKVKCKAVSGSENEFKFKSLYICWGSLKKGFLEGCRPVIGLDGCHLKGPHGGILLTAVGIDANNCTFPFAYAVVGKEKKKTWFWFLEILKEDLNVQNTHRYTFMTDKQKGLIDAVSELFPNAPHRFCVRHLYNNFKEHFKELVLKDLLWKAARSCIVPRFTQAMEEIKAVDNNAFNWLIARPAVNWSRSHFDTFPQSDIVLNNLCESFNSAILPARDKPIISMLERIRLILMECIQKRHTVMLRSTDKICPKIKKIVDKLREDKGWLPRYFGNEQFQVEGPNGQQYKVDLKNKTCGYRRWDLSGIPCVHSIAAYNKLGRDPMEHVSDCYSVQTYLKSYENVLGPINGRDMWPDSGGRILLPPDVKRRAGRPRKARRREPDEVVTEGSKVLSKKGVVKMTCSACHQPRHNKRGCKKGTTGEGNAIGEPSTAGQGKRKKGASGAGQGKRKGPSGAGQGKRKGPSGAGRIKKGTSIVVGGVAEASNAVGGSNAHQTDAVEASVVTTGASVLTASPRQSKGATMMWRGKNVMLASHGRKGQGGI